MSQESIADIMSQESIADIMSQESIADADINSINSINVELTDSKNVDSIISSSSKNVDSKTKNKFDIAWMKLESSNKKMKEICSQMKSPEEQLGEINTDIDNKIRLIRDEMNSYIKQKENEIKILERKKEEKSNEINNNLKTLRKLYNETLSDIKVAQKELNDLVNQECDDLKAEWGLMEDSSDSDSDAETTEVVQPKNQKSWSSITKSMNDKVCHQKTRKQPNKIKKKIIQSENPNNWKFKFPCPYGNSCHKHDIFKKYQTRRDGTQLYDCPFYHPSGSDGKISNFPGYDQSKYYGVHCDHYLRGRCESNGNCKFDHIIQYHAIYNSPCNTVDPVTGKQNKQCRHARCNFVHPDRETRKNGGISGKFFYNPRK